MTPVQAPIEEAKENLRVIRQTMDRSTKYSTLSGWSGILIGMIALLSVSISGRYMRTVSPGSTIVASPLLHLALIWSSALVAAICVDFVWNKRRASGVGKRIVSKLGAHVVLAALPAFFAGGILSYFLYSHGLIWYVWPTWTLCYGLAICAVGIFSVRPVSVLGSAFVILGAISILLPAHFQTLLMAVSFGGFHIAYGAVMGRKYGW